MNDLQYEVVKLNFDKEETEMKIDTNKKYRTRDGHDVEIIAIRPELKDGVIGIIEGEDFVREWDKEGFYSHDKEFCNFDLIEVTPYADFKVDDKVLIKDKYDKTWSKRYFAGIIDGKPHVFINGTTSWSNNNKTKSWDNIVRWEDRTDDMVIDNE